MENNTLQRRITAIKLEEIKQNLFYVN